MTNSSLSSSRSRLILRAVVLNVLWILKVAVKDVVVLAKVLVVQTEKDHKATAKLAVLVRVETVVDHVMIKDLLVVKGPVLVLKVKKKAKVQNHVITTRTTILVVHNAMKDSRVKNKNSRNRLQERSKPRSFLAEQLVPRNLWGKKWRDSLKEFLGLKA
jgi:ribosome-binding ATPase YchF (GTP1/OBG family)